MTSFFLPYLKEVGLLGGGKTCFCLVCFPHISPGKPKRRTGLKNTFSLPDPVISHPAIILQDVTQFFPFLELSTTHSSFYRDVWVPSPSLLRINPGGLPHVYFTAFSPVPLTQELFNNRRFWLYPSKMLQLQKTEKLNSNWLKQNGEFTGLRNWRVHW